MDHAPSADEARARAEHDRARRLAEGQLLQRSIALTGREDDEELEALLSAVEAFEAARARLGGDSFTNTLESTRPDDRSMVLPRREEGEAPRAYAARISDAAARLAGRAD